MNDHRSAVEFYSGSLQGLLSRQAADPAGTVYYLVDVTAAVNQDDFYAITYRSLFGSDCYGHNLDALRDVGPDVVHGDPAEGRYFDWDKNNAYTCVVFTGLEALVANEPEFCKSVIRILASCSQFAKEEGAELSWVIHARGRTYDELRRM